MCLLLLCGERVSSIMIVDIPQKVYKVARGENATIPCKFTPPVGDVTLIVTWSADPDVAGDPEISIATYLYNSASPKLTINRKYKGKADVEHDIPKGVANLQLKGVISSDTRTYECKAMIMGDEDGSQSDTASLVVLVAPSSPICKVVGVAEYGQNINLTCLSQEGMPKPTYKWQRHDVNNSPRPNPPKTTDENGILSLYNVSKDTSGFYICTSSNEIRTVKCNLTLAVMQPSMNMASTLGILGAVAAAIIILGIIIFCCCCRKKKNNPEEYDMGTPEGGEYTDKDPKARADSDTEHVKYEEEHRVQNADRRDPRDDRSERSYDRRSDYDDRRDNYSDRRDDNSDRRERYEKDDRRDRYEDRSDRYDDRRDRYDERSDRYDDRRDRNDDRHDHYDDRRDHYDSDRYSDRYDSRDRPPSVPPNKPRDQRN